MRNEISFSLMYIQLHSENCAITLGVNERASCLRTFLFSDFATAFPSVLERTVPEWSTMTMISGGLAER
jgi:hypothetical protein